MDTPRYFIRENRLSDNKTVYNICEINKPGAIATYNKRLYAEYALDEMNAFSKPYNCNQSLYIV